MMVVIIIIFVMGKKKDNRNQPNYIKAGLYGTGTALLGQQTIRSGIPRALGVRLESHSTSRKNAKSILKNGGYLDPNYGGTGASAAINNQEYIKNSKNYIHITGRHKNHKVISETAEQLLDDGTRVPIPEATKYIDAPKNPITNVLHRKMQRGMYRGLTGQKLDIKDSKDAVKALPSIGLGLTGLRGKTLYIGGSDRYFDKNFIPDSDDVALKSAKKVKVFGNRFAAVKDTLKRYGKGNYIKGAARLMGANKSRVAAGLGILGAGGLATAYLGKKTMESFGNVKSYNRKSKSGKIVKVTSYKRNKGK
jgi:hypothetical protein